MKNPSDRIAFPRPDSRPAGRPQEEEILCSSIAEDIRKRLVARNEANEAARQKRLPPGWREIPLPGQRLPSGQVLVPVATLDHSGVVVQVTPTLSNEPSAAPSPSASPAAPKPARVQQLDIAIRARLKPGGRTIPWSRLCDEIRHDCRVARDARGFGDKTIERITKKILAE